MNAVAEHNRLAKINLEETEGGAYLLCNWVNFAFIHYEVDPEVLQRGIPYRVLLYKNKAYVSLVAFTLEQFRFAKFEPLAKWLMKPIATHRYFNVRTYVTHGKDSGIYFIKEWISSRLCALIGSRMYELPCEHGKLDYRQDLGQAKGNVDGKYEFQMNVPAGQELTHAEKNSLDEFLLERYVAFVKGNKRQRYFRIWHEPWLQMKTDVRILKHDLLTQLGPWGEGTKFSGAHYSPGAFGVWMGKPQVVRD